MLFRISHPLPSVVVTAGATVLAVAAGNTASTCVLLAAAVLAGQLSVGWSNDRIDAARDRRVGHEGKPLARGELPLRVVDYAIVGAVLATVLLSLLLGWRAGLLHLAAVAAAWLYNGWLKLTWLSWLPYAFAFGALPAVATLALPTHPAPAVWIMVASALLGVAVNFVNVLPGLATQPRSDVHSLPDRLGGRASLLVAAVLLVTVAAMVVWFPPDAPTAGTLAGGTLAAALVICGVPIYWPRAHTRQPFFGLLIVAAVELLTLVLTAHPLH